MNIVQRFGPFRQQRFGITALQVFLRFLRAVADSDIPAVGIPIGLLQGAQDFIASCRTVLDKLARAASNNVRRIIVIFIRCSFLSKAHGAAFFQILPVNRHIVQIPFGEAVGEQNFYLFYRQPQGFRIDQRRLMVAWRQLPGRIVVVVRRQEIEGGSLYLTPPVNLHNLPRLNVNLLMIGLESGTLQSSFQNLLGGGVED